jgi:hypothetical protein
MNGRNAKQSVTIVIQDIPPSANVLNRKYRHPRSYKMLRDGWQRMIWGLVQGGDKSWLRAMCDLSKKMRVDITFNHRQWDDADNLPYRGKILLDCLRNLEFLRDDDAAHLELHVKQQILRDKETWIVIQEAKS